MAPHSSGVFLPGKSHGRRSLVGYSPWRRKESDTTEQLHFTSSLLTTQGIVPGTAQSYFCFSHPWLHNKPLKYTVASSNPFLLLIVLWIRNSRRSCLGQFISAISRQLGLEDPLPRWRLLYMCETSVLLGNSLSTPQVLVSQPPTPLHMLRALTSLWSQGRSFYYRLFDFQETGSRSCCVG